MLPHHTPACKHATAPGGDSVPPDIYGGFFHALLAIEKPSANMYSVALFFDRLDPMLMWCISDL